MEFYFELILHCKAATAAWSKSSSKSKATVQKHRCCIY